MSIIEEIVNFILERFNSCLAEVLQAIKDVLEDVKENKVIKKNIKKGEGEK